MKLNFSSAKRFAAFSFFALLILVVATTPVLANTFQPLFQRTLTGNPGAGLFSFPAGVEASSTNLYVADTFNNRIQVYTLQGDYVASFGASFQNNGSPDGLQSPRGIAVDSNNNIFVADSGHNRIVKFDGSYAFVAAAGRADNASGSGCDKDAIPQVIEFNSPYDVAVDSTNGFLYVADTNNDRVAKLNLNLALMDACWTDALDTTQFSHPMGIAVAANETGVPVYVADTLNSRVVKLNANDGSKIFSFGVFNSGAGPLKFRNPDGIAVDSTGLVYLADTGNHAIHKIFVSTISPYTAADLKYWGSFGTDNYHYAAPAAIAALDENNIYVADTNNNRVIEYDPEVQPTGISLSSTSIAEGNAVNALVGTFSATDPNTGSSFTYSATTIADTDCSGNSYFSFSSSLKANSMFDYETTPGHAYNICVKVSDGVQAVYGGPISYSKAFTIDITDGPDAPTAAAPLSFSMPEYTDGNKDTIKTGYPLPEFNVTDNDPNDVMSFQIISGTNNFDKAFTVQSTGAKTGKLVVGPAAVPPNPDYTTILNYETAPSHKGTVVVRVTDLLGHTYDATFTITLTNVNEPPKITARHSPYSMVEETAIGTQVGGLFEIDISDVDDSLSNLTIGEESLAVNPMNVYFALTGTGLQRGFAVETKSSYEDTANIPDHLINYTVKVTDKAGLSALLTIPVTITDVNEAPVLSLDYDLKDNSPLGTILDLATDPDAGDSLTYSIVDPGTSGSTFAIGTAPENLGKIILADKTLLIAPSILQLTVSVQDSRQDPPQSPVTGQEVIHIIHVNLPPVFVTDPAPTLSVAENAGAEASVGWVTATDSEGDSLSFETSDSNGPFQVSGQGEVTVRAGGMLDYESAAYYDLPVTVSDGQNQPVAHTFRVSITNVNEQISIDNKGYLISIGDRTSPNQPIGKMIWSDLDGVENTLPIFSLTGDGVNQFGINSSTGEIYILPTADLHYYKKSIYYPTITLDDKTGMDATHDSTTIAINLTDDNDPPTFEGGPFSVAENSLGGTVVGSFTVYDENQDAIQTLQIAGGTGQGSFDIVKTGQSPDGVYPGIIRYTWQISVSNPALLDYETATNHQLTLSILGDDGAADGTGADTHTFTINLANRNDPPVIGDQTFSTFQASPGGTLVGTIAATDPDAGTVLTYTKLGGSNLFSVDPATGEIKVINGPVQGPTYTISVKVTDNGVQGDTQPKDSLSPATITINITPKADPSVKSLSLPQDVLLTGSNIRYTVVLENLGGGASYAHDYTLQLTLPAGVEFNLVGSTPGCSMKTATTVECPGVAMASKDVPGSTVTYGINAFVYMNVSDNSSLTATARLNMLNTNDTDVMDTSNKKTKSFTARTSIVVSSENFSAAALQYFSKSADPNAFPTSATPLTTSNISLTPSGQDKFLGQFQNERIIYQRDLIDHAKIEVSFDLYLTSTWDGLNPSAGLDEWKLCFGAWDCQTPSDSRMLLDTTFSNNNDMESDGGMPFPQSFPDSLSSHQQHLGLTQASRIGQLGYTLPSGFHDSVYNLTFTFDHADPMLVLNFIGASNPIDPIETWGIDNLKVTISGQDVYKTYLPLLRH